MPEGDEPWSNLRQPLKISVLKLFAKTVFIGAIRQANRDRVSINNEHNFGLKTQRWCKPHDRQRIDKQPKLASSGRLKPTERIT